MKPQHLVIIGSSAGGPRILKELFSGLPRLKAAVVLVQHMPAFVNEPLTKSLDNITDMDVVLAQDGDFLKNGTVHVVPSGRHCVIEQNRMLRFSGMEKVNFVCPAVDVTMESVAADKKQQLTGIILTGMGRDGARGIVHMKSLGATTVAQDEATSIIYGMPQEAQKTGKIDFVLSTKSIAQKLVDMFSTGT